MLTERDSNIFKYRNIGILKGTFSNSSIFQMSGMLNTMLFRNCCSRCIFYFVLKIINNKYQGSNTSVHLHRHNQIHHALEWPGHTAAVRNFSSSGRIRECKRFEPRQVVTVGSPPIKGMTTKWAIRILFPSMHCCVLNGRQSTHALANVSCRVSKLNAYMRLSSCDSSGRQTLGSTCRVA